MANFEVDVNAITGAGIDLPADGEHSIRVLGARSEELVDLPAMKEDLGPSSDQTVFDQYYSGTMQAPTSADATAAAELFITSTGEAVLVETNLA